MTKEDFINKLLELHAEKKKGEAVELVYDYQENLLVFVQRTPTEEELKKDYTLLDEVMGELLDKDIDYWLLMPFLTLSGPHKEHLSNRDAFYGQFVQKAVKLLEKGELSEEQFVTSVKRLSWELG
jgi:hypothetical protein